MTKYQVMMDLLYPIFSSIIIIFIKWLVFDVVFYKCPLIILDGRVYNLSKEPLTICKITDSHNKTICLLRNLNNLIFHGPILTQNDSIFLNHNFTDIKFVKVQYIYIRAKKELKL